MQATMTQSRAIAAIGFTVAFASGAMRPTQTPEWRVSRPRSWVPADRVRDVGAWRVPDRDGFVEVETPPIISYRDVPAIVEAVRTARLVNRLPPTYRGDSRRLPKVDAHSIFLIWNSQSDPTVYKVNFRTTNVVLFVAVRGTVVELRDWATEQS